MTILSLVIVIAVYLQVIDARITTRSSKASTFRPRTIERRSETSKRTIFALPTVPPQNKDKEGKNETINNAPFKQAQSFNITMDACSNFSVAIQYVNVLETRPGANKTNLADIKNDLKDKYVDCERNKNNKVNVAINRLDNNTISDIKAVLEDFASKGSGYNVKYLLGVLESLGSLNSTSKIEKLIKELKHAIAMMKNDTVVPRKVVPKYNTDNFLHLVFPAADNRTSAVSFTLSTIYRPDFRFSYSSAFDLTNDFIIEGISLRVAFYRLVEIGQGYDINNSTHKLHFGNFSGQWTPINITSSFNNDTTFYTATTSLTPGGQWNNLQVIISVFFSGDLAALPSGDILTPNNIKWSVEIINFPYSFKDGSVVLVNDIHVAEGSLQVGSDLASVDLMKGRSFQWDTTCLSDGVLSNVNLISLKYSSDSMLKNSSDVNAGVSENAFLVAFQFPQGATDIYWDPSTSIDENQAASSNSDPIFPSHLYNDVMIESATETQTSEDWTASTTVNDLSSHMSSTSSRVDRGTNPTIAESTTNAGVKSSISIFSLLAVFLTALFVF